MSRYVESAIASLSTDSALRLAEATPLVPNQSGLYAI